MSWTPRRIALTWAFMPCLLWCRRHRPAGTLDLDPVDVDTGLSAQRSDGDLGPAHLGTSARVYEVLRRSHSVRLVRRPVDSDRRIGTAGSSAGPVSCVTHISQFCTRGQSGRRLDPARAGIHG